MFETFSKRYESAFRIIFIVWVSFWGIINLFQVLFQYASFANTTFSSSDLGRWWLNTVGTIVGLTIGILLLFIMSSVPVRVEAKKKLTNIGLLITLAVFYYLFPTLVSLTSSAVFDANNFARTFIFTTAWLLPSIILLIFHMIYFVNLYKYNEELQESPKA